MDEFVSDVPGSGAAPGGLAPPGLRLARLADAETGKVAAKLSPAGGSWCKLLGSVSKPCTPVVHIKIAGIYGCSSP